MREVAIDVRLVSHAWFANPVREYLGGLPLVGELTTLCGIRGRWQHLTAWWSPLLMVRKRGTVNCMTCLVAEARQ